jgi:FemAB-related protein (PEP-CTERM system-associated)
MSVHAVARPFASPIVVHAEPSASRWDAYVATHEAASGYHRSAWAGVIERAFGHETCYLTAESAGGIVGVLPLVIFRSRLFGRFVVSMPFLNYGGVLADGPDAEAALLEEAVARTRAAGARHLELRHSRQLFPHLPSKRHKVAMVLPLEPSEDEQWKALDRKVRNQVRKAQKSNLRTEVGGTELLSAFYQVFARNMRDLGTPVYGRRFFDEVLSTFGRSSRVFCVWLDATPVAASIVYSHKNMMEVPWASSVREHNPLCPNILLYWEMLRHAIASGCRAFDFGRSTPHEGTYEFKRQWGAQPRELVWEYWVPNNGTLPDLSPKNPRFGRAIDLWRRLPVPVATTLGPLIVRNIP